MAEQKNKNIILTGDRPTGKLHLGHFVGSLRRRVELQNSGKFDEINILIADDQALTDNAKNPQKIRDNMIEVALDYLSVGIDPDKTTICVQSQIPALHAMTFYFMNMVTTERLSRNPTIKNEITLRGFDKPGSEGIPAGFFTYPVSQTADITAFKANCVPVGEDQEPMIEQAREIVRRFNQTYGEVLVEPEIMLPDTKAAMRLPGIDGKAKMSKSLGNAIYLSDDPASLEKKVKSMYTDPQHLRKDDPGHLEGNCVFIYLDAFATDDDFAEFWPDYANLDELKGHYTKGGLGDMDCKKFLIKVLNRVLDPIRESRHEWEKRIPDVYDILKAGTAHAVAETNQTLHEMQKVMRINYFDDDSIVKDWENWIAK